MSRLATAALLLVALATPGTAQSRHDQALADLRRLDDAEARRSAVRALGDTGVMADLPAMVYRIVHEPPRALRSQTGAKEAFRA